MINKGIAKMCGQPKNVSANTGGRTTAGDKRPTKNSSISGVKFIGPCTATYGTLGVGK